MGHSRRLVPADAGDLLGRGHARQIGARRRDVVNGVARRNLRSMAHSYRVLHVHAGSCADSIQAA